MRQYLLIGLAVLMLCAAGVYALARPSAPPPVAAAPEHPPPRWPQESVIGHSAQGREIRQYTYGPSNSSGQATGTVRLLFVGGMHGGYEWNSVVLAYRFLDYLNVNTRSLPHGLAITVIPNINPDGVYEAIGKEGRFTVSDVPEGDLSGGRFNAHGVDLNRNFDCKWSPKGTWKGNSVKTGSAAFSEPESRALRDFVLAKHPSAVVFWHSQANAVYASQCNDGILPETIDIMNAYAEAAGYPAVKSFDAYPVNGDSEGWLASQGIPAITVELKTHETVEWDQNLAGIKALVDHFVARAKNSDI